MRFVVYLAFVLCVVRPGLASAQGVVDDDDVRPRRPDGVAGGFSPQPGRHAAAADLRIAAGRGALRTTGRIALYYRAAPLVEITAEAPWGTFHGGGRARVDLGNPALGAGVRLEPGPAGLLRVWAGGRVYVPLLTRTSSTLRAADRAAWALIRPGSLPAFAVDTLTIEPGVSVEADWRAVRLGVELRVPLFAPLTTFGARTNPPAGAAGSVTLTVPAGRFVEFAAFGQGVVLVRKTDAFTAVVGASVVVRVQPVSIVLEGFVPLGYNPERTLFGAGAAVVWAF